MAGPIDIENQPPDPHRPPGLTPRPGGGPGAFPPGAAPPSPNLQGQLPTTRASDLLRKPSAASTGSPFGGDPIKPDVDRRATPFDDAASGLFTVCALLFVVGLGYLLWGTWSGAFAGPNWIKVYAHADRIRAISNIQICGEVMWGALALGIVLFLFLFYHEDFAGFSLLAIAVLLQLGIPYATNYLYATSKFAPTEATNAILQLLMGQSWLIGIPGVLLTTISICRSMIDGLETAKVKRATYKFGQQAVKDVKPRNVFLGDCWNLPYCKESIRSKCPIFVAKRGPCWRNKRGCMCDQTILLIAQAPNWKQNVAATVGKLEGRSGFPAMPELPPQPMLSKEAKNERCRQCVIYNVHQEHKYKFIVGLVLVGLVAGLAIFGTTLLNFTGDLFMQANTFVSRFSISTNTAPLFPNGAPAFVEWLMLGSVLLVIIAKLLQLVEFFCFKLKI